MSSPTPKTPTQLAEIKSLSARLSTAKSNRSSQIGVINQLKMQSVNEYSILLRCRRELYRKDRKALSADSINFLSDLGFEPEEMDDIELQRTSAGLEWAELGSQLERAFEELWVLDQEISELERILDARKALQEGESFDS